jgi:hypothetical protein
MRFTNRIRAAIVGGFDLNALKDLDVERQRQATIDTARFVTENLSHLRGWRASDPHTAKLQLLKWAHEQAPSDGLAVEFGVATGETLRVIAEGRAATVHGFDSFEGLPEHWYGEYTTGTFAQPVPEVPGAKLHVGRFDAALPGFLEAHREPFAFVHMDADLYASTKSVFDLAGDRFVADTVIVFDEYFNYPGWEQHEHRAFAEFVARRGIGFEYIAYNAMHEQVAVRLL